MGHGGDDVLALHDLVHGHGDGLLRHIVDGGEPALANLLVAASGIQVHDQVGDLGVEVSGRIVEGDVRIAANADQAHIDGSLADLLGQGLDALGGAVHEVGLTHVGLGDEALLQVLAEGSDVGLGQVNVLVQVEHLDLGPVDVGLHQVLQGLELGSAGGQNDAGTAVLGDGLVNDLGRGLSSPHAQLVSSLGNDNTHVFILLYI